MSRDHNILNGMSRDYNNLNGTHNKKYILSKMSDPMIDNQIFFKSRVSFLFGLIDQHTGTLSRFASSDIFSSSVLTLIFQYLPAQLVAIASDKTLSLWSHLFQKPVQTFESTSSSIHSIGWSSDGTMIAAACQDKTVTIFNAFESQPHWKFEPHENGVVSMTWSPKSHFLATSSISHHIYLWDVSVRQKYHTISLDSDVIRSLSWFADKNGDTNTLAFIQGELIIKSFLLDSESKNVTFESNRASVFQIGWSPCQKQLASVSMDRSVYIWDGDTGKKIHLLKGHTFPVFHLAWSLDGSILATQAADNQVFIWDIKSGDNIRQIYFPTNCFIRKITFSPDTSMLSVACETLVFLYHFQMETFILFPRANICCDIAFCPLLL